MFIGHGLLAFAIVASVAAHYWENERALSAGLIAGLFATLPDVDVLFAVAGIAGAGGPAAANEAFWAAAHEFHRAVTHSLVVGGVVAVAAAAFRGRNRQRWLGVAGVGMLAGLVAVLWMTRTATAAAMAVPMVVGAVAVSALAGRLGFGGRTVGVAAAVGLLSHPFGDLLAGEPPAFLYPFETRLLTERIVVHPDATIHLLVAFFVELAVIWLAVLVFLRLREQAVRPLVRPRAAAGLAYAGAVLAVPAPTVEVASPFVFSVLSMGIVAVPLRERPQALAVLTTALAAVTVAALAYTAAYLVV